MNAIASYHRLQFYEEAIGRLIELRDEEEGTIALIGKECILLPEYVKEELCHYVGQRIAILKTDIKDKAYLIRVLPSDTTHTCQLESQTRSRAILDDN